MNVSYPLHTIYDFNRKLINIYIFALLKLCKKKNVDVLNRIFSCLLYIYEFFFNLKIKNKDNITFNFFFFSSHIEKTGYFSLEANKNALLSTLSLFQLNSE